MRLNKRAKGKPVNKSAAKSKQTLEQFAVKITKDNLHGEADMGIKVGKEVW